MIDLPKITPATTPVENNATEDKFGVKPVPVEERIQIEVKKPVIDRRKNLDRRKNRDKQDPLMELRHRDRRRGSIDIEI